MLVAHAAKASNQSWVVEPHAAGPLHDRLDNHSRDGVVDICCKFTQIRLNLIVAEAHTTVTVVTGRMAHVASWISWRFGSKNLFHQGAPPQRVHTALGVAHTHGPLSVAVISTSPRHEPVPFWVTIPHLILEGHLDGDLNRDRPRIRIKTGSRPSGVISTSHSAKSTAGLCVSPPNITCGI